MIYIPNKNLINISPMPSTILSQESNLGKDFHKRVKGIILDYEVLNLESKVENAISIEMYADIKTEPYHTFKIPGLLKREVKTFYLSIDKAVSFKKMSFRISLNTPLAKIYEIKLIIETIEEEEI